MIAQSNRAREFVNFSHSVVLHIDNYTVTQYGDMPDDQADGFSIHDIKTNMLRYVNRIGSNARGETEALRDCLKLAHYACILYNKIRKE
jgi:hypothetical protein